MPGDTCQIVSDAMQFEHGHDELHELGEAVPHQLSVHVLEANLARDGWSAVQESDAQHTVHEGEVLAWREGVSIGGPIYIYALHYYSPEYKKCR